MQPESFDILIVGAGVSGIGVACTLSAQCPDKTYAILERRQRLGGTWDLFRYPGVRSDSDMLTYSYRFRPWRSTKILADGSAIQRYVADTARQHGVDQHIRCGLAITRADWSSARQRWMVSATHDADGALHTFECRHLVLATGGAQPRRPPAHGQQRRGARDLHPVRCVGACQGVHRLELGLPGPSDKGCFKDGESDNGDKEYSDRDLRPMVAYPDYHSVEAKSFLGTTIPAGTSAVESLRIALDRLATHPNVGPFIGRQLIRRLATSNPSPSYVSAVASAFNNNGSGVRGDFRAVLKAVLLHPEALVVGDTSGKVREPVLRLSAFMRAFPHRSVSGKFDMDVTTNPGTALSQAALHSPSVFNFYRPGYVAPGTQSAARNLVAPELQIVNETSVAGYVNYMRDSISAGVGCSAGSSLGGRDLQGDYTAELALASDVPALVDRVTTRLTYGALGAARRTEIINAVGSIAIPGGSSSQSQINAAKRQRVNAAILLTVAAPEFVVIK